METPFDEIYVQPSAGDGGGALGAALYAWHAALGNERGDFVMDHAYWGQDYDEDAILRSVQDLGFAAQHIDNQDKLIDNTVGLLEQGKVIGWFQGRFEWGPRALGNRSILADPRSHQMKDIVNNQVNKDTCKTFNVFGYEISFKKLVKL